MPSREETGGKCFRQREGHVGNLKGCSYPRVPRSLVRPKEMCKENESTAGDEP